VLWTAEQGGPGLSVDKGEKSISAFHGQKVERKSFREERSAGRLKSRKGEGFGGHEVKKV